MQVKFSQAFAMIVACLKAKLVPNLLGSPGIGKSDLARKVANEFNLHLIDLRLSQCDPTDLSGFPSINDATGKAGYRPMDTFPIEGDTLPKGKNGWLIFLDEFNSAPQAVQAAAYKLVLDRMVGIHHLHSHVAMMCAGNLETDNAIVLPMSTAMQSRLVHIELTVDHKEWTEWAEDHGVDHRITDYIKFKPGQLYTFQPDHTDHTYGCPRTWHFADKIIKVTDNDSPERLPLLAGTLSEGLAREFVTYCKIYGELPKTPELLANPETAHIPQEASYLFALTGSLAHNANESNLEALMKYITRMPEEFQVVTVRSIAKRNAPLISHRSISKWTSVMGHKFYA